MATQVCPNRERWREVLAGRSGDGEQPELARHLETCDTCQQTLVELAAATDFRRGVAEHLGGPSQAVDDSLAVVLARLKATGADDRTGATAVGPTAAEAAASVLDPTDTPGALGRFAQYEIVAQLGSGGMGLVFQGHDAALGRPVAIKVLAPQLAASQTARQRFAREAKAAAAVTHENVVAIHAVDEWRGLPYLVMQYVAGESLQQRLDRAGPLPIDEAVRIASQIAAGLAAAHGQGLVHRDVKPGNVLLERDTGRVKLTDFGLARAVDDATLTQTGVVAGTPQYMAPEQARGEPVDPRSDLYSLGSVLFAMCSGAPPYRAGGSLAVVKQVAEAAAPSVRAVAPATPQPLVELVDRLHAARAEDRPASATEVATWLRQYADHLTQPEQTPPPVRWNTAPPSRSPINSKASLAIAMAALLAVLAWWQRDRWFPKQHADASGSTNSAQVAPPPPTAQPQPSPTSPKLKPLLGTWRVEHVQRDGQRHPPRPGFEPLLVVFRDGELVRGYAPGPQGRVERSPFRLTDANDRLGIDLVDSPTATQLGSVAAVNNTEALVAWSLPGETERPRDFVTRPGSKFVVWRLTRVDLFDELGRWPAIYLPRSPFSAVRWQGEQVDVQLAGEWRQLRAVEGVAIGELLMFGRKARHDTYRSDFEQHLAEQLSRLGHEPRDTVTLTVRRPGSQIDERLADVPMTEANARSILRQRQP